MRSRHLPRGRRRHAARIDEAATVEARVVRLAGGREARDELRDIGFVDRPAHAAPVADRSGEAVEVLPAQISCLSSTTALVAPPL